MVCTRFRTTVTQAEYFALYQEECETRYALHAQGVKAMVDPGYYHPFVAITTATDGLRPLPDLRSEIRKQIAEWSRTPAGVEAQVPLEVQLFGNVEVVG